MTKTCKNSKRWPEYISSDVEVSSCSYQKTLVSLVSNWIVRIWVFEFGHNLRFWAVSQFQFFSFVAIWVLSHFDFWVWVFFCEKSFLQRCFFLGVNSFFLQILLLTFFFVKKKKKSFLVREKFQWKNFGHQRMLAKKKFFGHYCH